jgi:hypothetical protein
MGQLGQGESSALQELLEIHRSVAENTPDSFAPTLTPKKE